MRCICAKKDSDIPLGRTGENDVEGVRFDVKEWPDLYGEGGSFVLVHKRPGDTQPYVCATAVGSSGCLVWVIQDVDVQYTGRGEAQLTYVVDSKVAKSVIYTTRISRSLEQEGELPEPYETMIEELIEAAANITTDAERAETARDAAEASEGNAKDSEDAAKRSEDSEAVHEKNAEAWAVGQRNGVDVPQDDVTYNNSAKHYAELASQGAEMSGYVFFDVNDEDGCMYITTAGHIGEDITFEVDEEQGILEVIYT